MLFGHDEGKNLKQLCNGEKDVICPEMGGTGGSGLPEARQNINYIGTNPITKPGDDTPANWVALGTGVAYFDGSGKLNKQPTAYGFVKNIVVGTIVYQTFYSMNGNSPVWNRSGNSSGWYSSSANWVKQLDETNGIQMKKVWENASLESSFSNQTLSLALQTGEYVKVEFCMDVTQQRVFGEIICEVGKTADFSGVIAQGSATTFVGRQVAVTTSGVTISGSKTSASNSNLIPYRIYTIKGVS